MEGFDVNVKIITITLVTWWLILFIILGILNG